MSMLLFKMRVMHYKNNGVKKSMRIVMTLMKDRMKVCLKVKECMQMNAVNMISMIKRALFGALLIFYG